MSEEKVIEISESEDDSDIEVIPNPVDTESANLEVIVVSDDEVEINEIPRVRHVKEFKFAPGKISKWDCQFMWLAPKIWWIIWFHKFPLLLSGLY